MALLGLAFFAVYREALETVLFYRSLLLNAGPGGWKQVLGGALLGAALMVAVVLAVGEPQILLAMVVLVVVMLPIWKIFLANLVMCLEMICLAVFLVVGEEAMVVEQEQEDKEEAICVLN